MQLKTILNRVQKFKSFVYAAAEQKERLSSSRVPGTFIADTDAKGRGNKNPAPGAKARTRGAVCLTQSQSAAITRSGSGPGNPIVCPRQARTRQRGILRASDG